MIKKLITLFKLGRKIAQSDALKIISKIHQPPIIIKIFFNIFSISFSKKNEHQQINKSEEKLCKSWLSLFWNEKDNILNKIVKASGGFLNFDAIESISDFAIFLPNLNKVINFLIIKFSTHYELKQYR